MKDHFRSVTAYPKRRDANGVVVRLIDSLGYRFYWATEGLTEGDYEFSPGAGCQTIGALVGHVWRLANWIHHSVLGKGLDTNRSADPEGQREQVLHLLYHIRQHVAEIGQEALFQKSIDGLAFWHILNGPLSDALTHTGQITSFRRLNGNAVPRHYVFLGYQKDT